MSEFEKLLTEVESIVNPVRITRCLAQELAQSAANRHTTYGHAMIRTDSPYFDLMGKLGWIDYLRKDATRHIPGSPIFSIVDFNYPHLYFLTEKALDVHFQLCRQGYYED